MARVNTSLTIKGKDTYSCSIAKSYTEKYELEQELTEADAFDTLVSFANTKGGDGPSVHNPKVVLIKNVSNYCAEIALKVFDWRNDSASGSFTRTDIHNEIDVNPESTSYDTDERLITFLLPAKEFIYLPHTRFINYAHLSATLESAEFSVPGKVGTFTADIQPVGRR